MNPPGSSVSTLIAIVNYRTPELTIACLRSLAAEVPTQSAARVAVVDNASGDGSVEKVRAAIDAAGWRDWAQVIASPVNGGFAAGNNLAIRTAWAAGERPQQVWLVNPDAQVRPGALATLLDFMQRHPRAGIIGGSLENEHGEPWPYAFRFPSVWSEIDGGLRLGIVSRWLRRRGAVRRMGDEPERVDWISGANFMIRSELIDRIGLMDEGYFLYFEETDYCLQAGRAGWECWYVPSARVMHIAGQSTGITGKASRRRRPAYWFESRRRFFVKNYGRAYTWLADLAWMSGYTLWRLRRPLQGKPDHDPPGMLVDFARHSVVLRPLAPVVDVGARSGREG